MRIPDICDNAGKSRRERHLLDGLGVQYYLYLNRYRIKGDIEDQKNI
jgi:hypothetical protein